MPLLGTVLARRALSETKLSHKLLRLYTQRRAKDRSHKLWGFFNEAEAKQLVAALDRSGAFNARVSYLSSPFRSGRSVSGVRFEVPETGAAILQGGRKSG